MLRLNSEFLGIIFFSLQVFIYFRPLDHTVVFIHPKIRVFYVVISIERLKQLGVKVLNDVCREKLFWKLPKLKKKICCLILENSASYL